MFQSRSWSVACVAALLLSAAVGASPASASFVTDDTTGLSWSAVGGPGADVKVLNGASPGSVRIEEYDPDDDLSESAPNCEHTGDTDPDASPEVVECTAVSPLAVALYGSDFGDSMEAAPSVTFQVQMFGYDGNDVLLGGGGADRLAGFLGNDEVDGRDGPDLVENGVVGFPYVAGPASGDGADTYTDTGASGTDIMSFGFTGAGVQLFVGNGPLSGAPGENDTVGAGFEWLRGSAHGDNISGGAEPETIKGSGGNDTISGGGGADTLEGNAGDDVVNAISGDVDAAVLCDSPSDNPATVGTADIAYLDETPADPQPGGCETLYGPGEKPWTPGGGGGGTTPPGGGGGGTTPPPATGPVLGTPFPTQTVSRMPRVTGKTFAAARAAVLEAIPAADLDLDFRRGCKSSADLDIVAQSPAVNASLPGNAMDPVAVKLTTCLAERDFLRDCDLKDLRADVKKLPKSALDAEVGLAFAKTVNRCKVDYDVKIAKQAEEAQIRLAAQKAQAEKELKTQADREALARRKAELKVGINCPATGELRVAVADGYTPNRRAMGLRASGPGGWTLPAEFDAFVEVTLIDRAFQFAEATVYTDADEVSYLKVPPKVTKDGRVQIALKPFKGPGKIRMCVVLETGDDQVATGALEITVVKRPANGTIWETTSGRRLQVTKDGVVLPKARTAPVARAAFGLGDLWDAIVSLFDGRSRAITSKGGGGTAAEKTVKLVDTYSGPKYGAAQITLDGKLVSDPQEPVIENGPCIAAAADGTLRMLTCPRLMAPGGKALVGTALGGAGLVAAGGGNVVRATKGNLVGQDGSTLIGQDGGTLISDDGSTLIGQDGGSLIGQDGGTLIGQDGGSLVAAGGLNAIATAPNQLVAAGGLNLIPGPGGGLVAAGGLN